MWRNIVIVFIVFLVLQTGCKQQIQPTESLNVLNHRDTLLGRIKLMEKQIKSTSKIDYAFGATLVKSYLDFVSDFPQDAMAADYLFKAGEVSMHCSQADKAIAFFGKLRDLYPQSQKCPLALFLQAYIYDSQLKESATAKKIYLSVIREYPTTKVAEDAKASIDQLGLSDQDLMHKLVPNK